MAKWDHDDLKSHDRHIAVSGFMPKGSAIRDVAPTRTPMTYVSPAAPVHTSGDQEYEVHVGSDGTRTTGPIITNTARANESAEQQKARENRGVRTFSTGATRDTDAGKLDFEGFLSPIVLKAFAEYMHEKRKMPDGSMRDSDNWQKGIPLDAYMKSMWRHFFDTWESHRNGEIYGDVIKTELLALLFNVQGYLHEVLKERQ